MSTTPTEDSEIAFAQSTRRKIIDMLMANPEAVKDPELAKIVLKAIDGMATTALGGKRIVKDEEIGGSMEAARDVIKQIFLSRAEDLKLKAPKKPIELPDNLLDGFEPNPGELDQKPATVNFETFATEHGIVTDPSIE